MRRERGKRENPVGRKPPLKIDANETRKLL
jgi:hypothetical protein